MTRPDPATLDVIAPNFKRRLSGVTATVVRLVPMQARSIGIATVAPALPDDVPQITLTDLIFLRRNRLRVWHARRNSEMLAGLALKYILRKRLRLLFTSASQRRHTGYSKWLIRQMDAVISTSARTAEYLDRPSTVIRHGIDVEGFSVPIDKPALKDAMGLPPGPLIGCYGRIRAQKGTDVFVDAMIRVLADRTDATAIVMGRATGKHQAFAQDLRARVTAAGLADRILFKPEVAVHDIAAWYQVLDLFIAPQRWEGFGLTPLEAMACGVPVIATTVGAFPELVVPGETGALVAPGDVDAMAQATIRLLDDTSARAEQAAKARAHVAETFPIEAEAAAITTIYRALLTEGQ